VVLFEEESQPTDVHTCDPGSSLESIDNKLVKILSVFFVCFILKVVEFELGLMLARQALYHLSLFLAKFRRANNTPHYGGCKETSFLHAV
jgi:hypothetical protein